MKNEPEDYSIDDLKRDKTEPWDGIRNYQVRNMIRDDMSINDQAFFYHSNCDVPGIYGIMTINSNAYPDYTAFDKKAKWSGTLATFCPADKKIIHGMKDGSLMPCKRI